MRRTRGHRIRAGAALGVLALVLTACGSDDSSSPTGTPEESDGGESSAPAGDGSTLVIWADNSANTAKAVEPLCQAWAEANGVTCTVKKFNGGAELQEALIRAQDTGDVPDIYEGPHDAIGLMVDSGILAPVDISANAASFSEPAVAAVQFQGNSYGVPWAVENIAMLTNKKLSPECPATLDEAVANAEKLIGEGKVTEGLGIAMQIGEAGDFYHWYPLFTADGGYAFAQNEDGTLQPRRPRHRQARAHRRRRAAAGAGQRGHLQGVGELRHRARDVRQGQVAVLHHRARGRSPSRPTRSATT